MEPRACLARFPTAGLGIELEPWQPGRSTRAETRQPEHQHSRSNDPFGFDTTTGGYGSQGSYWYPGDADKGDIARMLFYSDTRWSSQGLSLTDGFPSG